MRERSRLISAALAAALVAGCSYADVDGEGPRAIDVEAPSAPGEAPADPVPEASEEPGPVAAPPTTCAFGGLALCFGFDGAAKDGSLIPVEPAEVSGVTFVAGREGDAALFDAMSVLRFAPSAAFELPSDAATVEAWIKRSATGADAVVFDDDARFSLTVDAGGHVWCKSSGGAVTGTRIVPVDTWAHVACVVDGATLRAYLDGVEDGSGPGAIGSSPASGAAIGGNAPSGEPFIGAIDALRVFRVARTPEQIAAAAAD